MGTSRTPAELASKLKGAATSTEAHAAEIVDEGAKVTKEAFLAAAAVRGLRPGGKIAGKPWSVRYAAPKGEKPSTTVKFVGPLQLVESATKAHDIQPKKKRRGKPAAIRVGADGIFASVHHPGTKGKHFFAAGKAAAERTAPTAMATKQRAVWLKALG